MLYYYGAVGLSPSLLPDPIYKHCVRGHMCTDKEKKRMVLIITNQSIKLIWHTIYTFHHYCVTNLIFLVQLHEEYNSMEYVIV